MPHMNQEANMMKAYPTTFKLPALLMLPFSSRLYFIQYHSVPRKRTVNRPPRIPKYQDRILKASYLPHPASGVDQTTENGKHDSQRQT